MRICGERELSSAVPGGWEQERVLPCWKECGGPRWHLNMCTSHSPANPIPHTFIGDMSEAGYSSIVCGGKKLEPTVARITRETGMKLWCMPIMEYSTSIEATKFNLACLFAQEKKKHKCGISGLNNTQLLKDFKTHWKTYNLSAWCEISQFLQNPPNLILIFFCPPHQSDKPKIIHLCFNLHSFTH